MSGRPCIFGEVLFDHFPDGRRVLGGAPFNVAWHLQAFGEEPFLVSRVGEDEDGEEVQRAMRAWGMEPAGLQTGPELPTGRVQVRIDDGEPSYDIVYPSAWDAIEESDCPAGGCALLYHGSLALRDETSRRACDALRARRPATVFIDVNLRPPWYRPDRLLAGLKGAHWVKLNRHELDELAPGGDSADRRARDFLARHDLRGLVLTDGADGAAVLTADGEHCEARPEANVPVVDTVGAGDALAAVMILGLLRGWPLGASLERAQSFASAVVGQRGATIREPGFYTEFINAWSRQAAKRSARDPANR
jgi:fructokinase